MPLMRRAARWKTPNARCAMATFPGRWTVRPMPWRPCAKGMRNLGEAMAQDNAAKATPPKGKPMAAPTRTAPATPWAASRATQARIGSDRNLLQGDDVYRRAQDLLDEIRRRSGDQTRPESERDYLKRLLDMF